MEAKALSSREKELLEGIVNILKKNLKPKKIILFGSRGKGKFSKNSDFDLAIDIERPDMRVERKIQEEIDKVSGLYKVDIIYIPSVATAFSDIVIKTGKVIYERRN